MIDVPYGHREGLRESGQLTTLQGKSHNVEHQLNLSLSTQFR